VVVPRHARGDPTDVLVTMSRHSAQLVLGSRGRGRLASGLFGSVSRALIRRAGCPVVVARAHAAAGFRTPSSAHGTFGFPQGGTP
jgi:nucleotide-binding universal stress UspA family protein